MFPRKESRHCAAKLNSTELYARINAVLLIIPHFYTSVGVLIYGVSSLAAFFILTFVVFTVNFFTINTTNSSNSIEQSLKIP